MNLRFATRASILARQQTTSVITLLERAHPGLQCSEQVISTRGDRELGRPLPEIGGKGVFTLELEEAILSGAADAAVHSLKDLPVEDSLGLVIGAIPQRADVQDVLVSPRGYTLQTLPPGTRVGTSSPRRAAQLLAFRPDLRVQSLRGNVHTRLQKVEQGDFEAIILAAAGLIRLGLKEKIAETIPLETILPAPGQGALAVQCRANDPQVCGLLAAIEDLPTRSCVQAERGFLAGLGGGCSLPVAAYARITNPPTIEFSGLVASLDGRQVIRVEGSGVDPAALGAEMSRLAIERGADRLLQTNFPE